MTRNVRVGIGMQLALAVFWAPSALGAQGTLSTQGLGFPPGQLSSAARALGGSTGEIDPISPLNPAAIGIFRTPVLFMQAEPEFREVRIGGAVQRSSIARFPLFVGALPLGSRWGASASASTLLDRTWTTTVRDTQFLGNDTLAAGVVRRSDGSIADLRLALAYAVRPWLRIGLGGHTYSGRDFIETARVFDDSTRFRTDTQSVSLSFGGAAVSLGAHAVWPGVAAFGLTLRKGADMRLYDGGNVIASARAPDHIGMSVAYLGLRGSTLALRVASDRWSALEKLGGSLNVHEGLDIGAGAEVPGPRFGSSGTLLRLGGRWRTLPFSVDANAVKERTLSGGFGLPFSGGRVELHLGALRSSRSGTAGVTENAWTVSTGFAVRP